MSSKTILIADDEPHMRRLLQFTLKRTGHEIVQTESGEAAVTHIRQHPVDLLIIDYGLTGMNGLETIKAVQKLPAGTGLPVILLTSRGDTGIRDEAKEVGVSAFLTKPFSPVELTRLVGTLLAS